ncbi:hypothetical protein MBLNU457_5511t2 [Dothideomycetes sp. NU457]
MAPPSRSSRSGRSTAISRRTVRTTQNRSIVPTSSSKSRSRLYARYTNTRSSTPAARYIPPSQSAPPSASAPDPVQDAEESLASDDSLNEIVMAVNVQSRGTVGCAYYVAQEERLYFMEDVTLGGADVVEALKLFISPTTILVPYRLDETILDRIDSDYRSRETSTDGRSEVFNLPYQLDLRPSAEFNHESAKHKLVNLKIGQENGPRVAYVGPGDVLPADDAEIPEEAAMTEQGQLLRLAGWIDLESQITVGCAGAILAFIHRRRAGAFLPGDEQALNMFRVSTIEMFSLRGSMFANMDTLLSLQIIQSEAHPHTHNQGPKSSGSKEGFSVYGLFHHLACTPQGKLLLRQYFLRPSLNLDVINQRLDATTMMLRPNNVPIMEALTKHLRLVKNMRTVMVSLRKGISEGVAGRGTRGGITRTVWSNIREFVFRALAVRDAVRDFLGADHLLIVQKVLTRFDGQPLAMVGRSITDIIDFEESQEQRRTVVKAGVNEELDNMRSTYDGLETLLSRVAHHIAKTVPAELDVRLNVVYFPQIGFLITVPFDPDTGSGVYEGDEDDPWEKMFTTHEFAYYKNSHMSEMDSYLGDVYGQIRDKEIEITQDLAERVLEYEEMLTSVSDICGELDSLIALAQGARNYNFKRPRVVESNVLQIRGGRHPLQELAMPSYIANDTLLVGGTGSDGSEVETIDDMETESEMEGFMRSRATSKQQGPSMVIVTGPNYSGKSVYLKQVALITFLAHVGSFVPADSATIGLTDKILTRVATRESVSRDQSAFMIDLQQVSIALSLATHRSLLIFDEFGKGTESYDGAGLAAGVFNHLLSRGDDCPKILAATHFHEIFERGFLLRQRSLAFGHMEVRIDPNASEIDQQLTYLYNYRNGRSTSSYGTCKASIPRLPSATMHLHYILPFALLTLTAAEPSAPLSPFQAAIPLLDPLLSTLPTNTFPSEQSPTTQDLLKRQATATSCPQSYSNCAGLGAPGLCCVNTAVCSADYAGHVACCNKGAACTGTIASVITAGTIGGTSNTGLGTTGFGGAVLGGAATTTGGSTTQTGGGGGLVVASSTAGATTTTNAGFYIQGGTPATTLGSVGGRVRVSAGLEVLIAALGLLGLV